MMKTFDLTLRSDEDLYLLFSLHKLEEIMKDLSSREILICSFLICVVGPIHSSCIMKPAPLKVRKV